VVSPITPFLPLPFAHIFCKSTCSKPEPIVPASVEKILISERRYPADRDRERERIYYFYV